MDSGAPWHREGLGLSTIDLTGLLWTLQWMGMYEDVAEIREKTLTIEEVMGIEILTRGVVDLLCRICFEICSSLFVFYCQIECLYHVYEVEVCWKCEDSEK